MSWVEKIQTDLVITTGDGAQYRPQWMNAQKAKEFNVSEFEFVNIPGTLIDRRLPKGTRFSLELHFTGDDNLDVSSAFEASSADPRAWTITHPFYGEITVQPLDLTFDNSQYNVSTVTGTVVETIVFAGPEATVNAVDKIAADKEAVDAAIAAAFEIGPAPGADEINQLADTSETLYTQGKELATTDEETENYFNLFNAANAAILGATADPLTAMRATQGLLNYPAQLATSVTDRVNLLIQQFDSLTSNIENYDTPGLKLIFESNGASLIGAMCIAASTPQPGNYYNRNSVLIIINQLVTVYNSYVVIIDGLQTANGGSPSSYIPNPNGLQGLSNLVKYTVSALFLIAQDAKQERSIQLEYDSNAIMLTHRFYGLDEAGSNFDLFVNTNNIGISEILQIRKGRTIVYYV